MKAQKEVVLTQAAVGVGLLHLVIGSCGRLVTMLGSRALPGALAARLGSPEAAHPGLWGRSARSCNLLQRTQSQ